MREATKKRTLRFTLALILLTVMPMLYLWLLGGERFSLGSMLLVLIVVYSSFRLAVIAMQDRKLPVATTFFLFVYFFLGVIPLAQVTTGIFSREVSFTDFYYSEAAFLIFVSLGAFEVGYFGIRAKHPVFAFLNPNKPITKAKIRVLSALFLGVVIGLVPFLGGVEIFLLPRKEQYAQIALEHARPVHLLLRSFVTTPLYIVLVAAFAITVTMWKCRKTVGAGWYVLVIGLFVTVVFLNNPVSTPRLKIGTIMLSLWFVLPWVRWYNLVTMVGLVAGLLFVFPLMSTFRRTLDVDLGHRLSSFNALSSALDNADFSAFQVIATIQYVAVNSDYQFGRQILGAILFWFPRSVWSGKPTSTSSWASAQMGYDNPGISAPLWSEFFVDGGWLLTVVGFCLYGFIVRNLDDFYALSQRSMIVTTISVFVPVFAAFQIFLLRGSLMAALSNLAPFVLITLLLSRRTPRLSWGVNKERAR